MEENNKVPNEGTEEKKQNVLTKKTQVKGKPLKIWIVVVIIVFMLFTFGIGLSLGKELYGNKDNNEEKKAPKEEEKTNVKKGVTDTNAVSRLEQFVIAASYNDSVGNGYSSLFMKGTTSIEQNVKYAVAWNSLIMIKQIPTTKVEIVPDKYKDDDHFLGDITEIAIDEYTNEYKRLFNQEPNYNEIGSYSFGCPGPYKIDTELGKIFIGKECGGTGNPEYYYKIYNYEEDDSFYYVYQYVAVENPINKTIDKIKSNETVNVSSFEGNEDKFETVVWKFDKNFNFISTENVGVVSK